MMQMRSGKILSFLKNDSSEANNILLTGIPRSGTTLACRLLCDFSQTIALNEPMDQIEFANSQAAEENIKKHFKNFRKSLLYDGTAIARTENGQLTDNAYSQNSSRRERVVKRSKIIFNKPLKRDFTLVMKHCAEFSLLLPNLAKVFSIYALIRNPLAILSSWASVDVPVSRGKVAKSAQLNPDFHTTLANQGEDILQRQLFILSWYFGQYNDFARENIIRYEEMVESPVKSLRSIAKGEPQISFTDLKSKNTSDLYSRPQVQRMGEALLNSEGHYWQYYSRDNVKQLL